MMHHASRPQMEPSRPQFNECKDKLDLEKSIKAKFNPSQTMWPWLFEYAAQTLYVVLRISGDDGLTATHRIWGWSATAPWPRVGEGIMHKQPKVVNMSKSEPRWRCVVWIGPIEASASLSWNPAGCNQGKCLHQQVDRDLRPKRSTRCRVHRGDREPIIGEPRSEHKKKTRKTRATMRRTSPKKSRRIQLKTLRRSRTSYSAESGSRTTPPSRHGTP